VIDRRTFLAGTSAVLLAAPLAVQAQQAKKLWRIGYLSGGSSPIMAPYVATFREGLRNRGLIEGENIVVEYRWADGNNEKLPALARELVALKVDVLVASGTPAAVAAKHATSQIPIVFTTVSDPVASGLVASLARPGGNATGWSTILPDMGGKLLGLIRVAVPSASRIAVLANPTNPGKVLEIKAMRDQTPSLGVTIQSVEVPTPGSLDAAFSTMGSARPDALVTLFDTVTLSNRGRIVEFAARHRIPAIYQLKEFADAGGLMSYGPSLQSMLRRTTAIYVERILKGAKPADLPVEQPTTFELVINLKTAKALGLTIPPSLLGRADEVIQ
jgi:putative ABC transport system substrate-binding protein